MTPKRFVEKVLNKFEWKFVHPALATKRRNKLKTTDFTVISNNCWGGRVYEYFDIQKQSPTVGMYFFAKDYVKFCSDLKGYLAKELVLITADESAYKDILYQRGEQNVIVGRLGDIEIVFLHYHDKDELMAKWKRRIERIRWDNVILKFSYQNQCTDELIREFLDIPGYEKICFVGEKIESCPEAIVFGRHNGKETVDETENFDKYVDVLKIINERLHAEKE